MCSIFNIVLHHYAMFEIPSGKIVVMDEAHKYLGPRIPLTESILKYIRLKRHYGLRIILSTQEPDVLDHKVLSLCSAIIIHRIQSPAWWQHIEQHVGKGEMGYRNVIELNVGEAIIFSSQSICTKDGQIIKLGNQRQLPLVKSDLQSN
jgi:DNA helicase HerA-like ATPase